MDFLPAVKSKFLGLTFFQKKGAKAHNFPDFRKDPRGTIHRVSTASQENVENSVEKVENIVGKPGLFSQFRWKTQWKEWISPSEHTKSGYNMLF